MSAKKMIACTLTVLFVAASSPTVLAGPLPSRHTSPRQTPGTAAIKDTGERTVMPEGLSVQGFSPRQALVLASLHGETEKAFGDTDAGTRALAVVGCVALLLLCVAVAAAGA